MDFPIPKEHKTRSRIPQKCFVQHRFVLYFLSFLMLISVVPKRDISVKNLFRPSHSKSIATSCFRAINLFLYPKSAQHLLKSWPKRFKVLLRSDEYQIVYRSVAALDRNK